MALLLASHDERLDLLEVVDRNWTHEAVLELGEQGSLADKAEQLVVNVARRCQVDGSHAIAQGTGYRAQLGAPARDALAAKRSLDTLELDEGEAPAVGSGKPTPAVEQDQFEDAQTARQFLRED